MIHMVTQENRALYSAYLAEMHRLRRIYFVEERGWRALRVEDGQERDQFDDQQAIYFIALDSLGRIEVAMRARPTLDGSMLGDIFPHLVAPTAEPIRAPGVWEISRIFATRAARARRGIRRRAELFLATVEAAHARGVHRLVGMTDVFLLPQTLSAGWRAKIIGLPAAYDEGEAIAVEVDSSAAGLRAMQERWAVRRSLVLHLEPDHPLAVLGPMEAEALYPLIARGELSDLQLTAALSARIVQLQSARNDQELEDLIAGVASAFEHVRQSAGLPAHQKRR